MKPSPRKKPKANIASRTLIYILMVLTILAVVAVMVLVIRGYRYNPQDGKLEQGGLLQYDSRPSGADVFMGETRLANQTPNKVTVSSGTHTIKMTKKGYNDWRKTVTISPGRILWLNYTRLVPTNKQIDTVLTYPTLSSAITSKNQKYYAVKDDPATPVFSLINVDTETPKSETIELAADAYTKPAEDKPQSFTLVRWDEDGRYVLIRHDYDGDKREWLVADTRGDRATLNVTTALGVSIQTAEFALDDSRSLYALTTEGELRRLNLAARTLSAPLVANVAEFAQYDRSTLTFVTKQDETTKKRGVGYYTDGATKSRLIKSYADADNTPLHLQIAKYFGKTYVAIAYGETLDITTGDLLPSDSDDTSTQKSVASLTIPGGVTRLRFSPEEQRFVYAENSTSVSVYDLELNAPSSTTFANAGDKAVTWVDRAHFVAADGGLALYDFDGTNKQPLLESSLPFPGLISPNNKYFFGFRQTEKGAALTRVKLVVD